jgi:cytochrome c
MKKNVLILSLSVFFFACGSGDKSGSGEKETTKTSIVDNPDFDKGLNLVAKSDCLGCHKTNEVSIGPAYNLIGQKYENTEANIALLADKIINGGSGVWGAVPMAAHNNISKEDATAMVKYIMLLKDEK